MVLANEMQAEVLCKRLCKRAQAAGKCHFGPLPFTIYPLFLPRIQNNAGRSKSIFRTLEEPLTEHGKGKTLKEFGTLCPVATSYFLLHEKNKPLLG